MVQRHWHFRSKNCPWLSIQYGLLLYFVIYFHQHNKFHSNRTLHLGNLDFSAFFIILFIFISFCFALFTNLQRLLLLRTLLLLPLAYQMCDTWNMDSITAINAWVELIFIVTLTLNFWRATYDDDNGDDFTHFMVYFYLSRFIFSSTLHFILVTINLLGCLRWDCQKMKKRVISSRYFGRRKMHRSNKYLFEAEIWVRKKPTNK